MTTAGPERLACPHRKGCTGSGAEVFLPGVFLPGVIFVLDGEPRMTEGALASSFFSKVSVLPRLLT